jgi:hypothetical protein
MVAPQVVSGLLQKVVVTSLPDVMAEQGSKYLDQVAGGFTPEQRKRIQKGLEQLRERKSEEDMAIEDSSGAKVGSSNGAALVPLETRDVLGENKHNPAVTPRVGETYVRSERQESCRTEDRVHRRRFSGGLPGPCHTEVTVRESPSPISAPTSLPDQMAYHDNEGGQERSGRMVANTSR